MKKYRAQALKYIENAIKLNIEYKAGRKRAAELKMKLKPHSK